MSSRSKWLNNVKWCKVQKKPSDTCNFIPLKGRQCKAEIVNKPRSWPTGQYLDQWRCSIMNFKSVISKTQRAKKYRRYSQENRRTCLSGTELNRDRTTMNMNTCVLNTPESGLHDDDIQYPERSILLALRGSFVSLQLRNASAKARSTKHTNNYTTLRKLQVSLYKWQARRSGSTTLLRNRTKL